MRTTTIILLIFGCLLHLTWGSASDSCSKGKMLPINVDQVNGLWNMKALASHDTLPNLRILDKVHYSYAKLSLSEKEGTITESFNPMEGIYDDPIPLNRVDDEKTLTYRKKDEELPALYTFVQPHPDVLMVSSQSNGNPKLSALYVRSSSHPEVKLEEFKEWAKCKGFNYFKEFDITVDYAQKCYGLLEEERPLHLEKTEDKFNSWNLMAKSSSFMDQHYNVRIFYTARLEISRKEHTLKEIITAPIDNMIYEIDFGSPNEDGNTTLAFKTEDGLLLLGVRMKTERILYLASRTTTVRKSIIEKFKAQAVCFETKFNYFIPGSIGEDDGDEACSHHLDKWVPVNFRESVGKWVLTVSAFEDTEAFLNELSSSYGATEISLVDDKVHLSHISIEKGAVNTFDDIEVEENTGHITYRDIRKTRAAIHKVSPNCIVFSPEGQRVFLNCRGNQLPPNRDIVQFVKFATCRHFHKILIRQSASFMCSEMAAEVDTLDVEKIAGTWTLVAVASNIQESDVKFPNEIQFTVNNGEVTISDGTWKSTAKKIGNNRLQYAKGHEHAMEMRFHERIGDSLLAWCGNPKEHKIFLVLFSKSGHVTSDELVKFKHFAACLSVPVVFLKE